MLNNRPLILASSSPYRKALLTRLQTNFHIYPPNIDETRLPNETAVMMIKRLSLQKAEAVALLTATQTQYANALIIGSDQCAILDGKILGKPKNHENAILQLQHSSGKQVDFLTGLCLYNNATEHYQLDYVSFAVQFRHLQQQEIIAYLKQDQPYNCTGSFKAEGLGITLFKKMIGDDPTALIGLPLIRLCEMLRQEWE